MAKNLAIAVIDDDDSFRVALLDSLSSIGYDVHGYASAEEFVAEEDNSSFDCVLSDLHMPGMSGLDLVRHLASRHLAAPVIVITARHETGLESKVTSAGAACFLRKPFQTADLVNCLTRVMEQ